MHRSDALLFIRREELFFYVKHLFGCVIAQGGRYKMIKHVAVIFLVSLVAACASAPVEEIKPFDKSRTMEASYDEVWTNLIRFMSTNDVSIASVEKDSGLIVLTGDNLTGALMQEYCDAKPAFLAALSGGKASGSVIVNADGDFTTVTVNARFSATYVNAMANPPVYSTRPCNSRGAFETAVLGSIQ